MSAAPSPSAAAWRPQANPWLIAAAVMLATVLEVLDTTVANVALPHIAGNLSVTPEDGTWMLTSYLVANAIVLPMTGWLARRFGRKRFLMWCVTGFVLSSAACGAAPSLPFLVVARVLQGAAGGALQPLSQAILMESFPPHKRGMAMAVFGLGVVCAPIIGPTLGGWITDTYSWRWIFYINLPLGGAALLMCRAFIEDPPYLKESLANGGKKMDLVGFGLLALWLATLQIVLDKGQQADWFNAAWVCWFSVVSCAAMLAFIWHELHVERPLVDLRVLANRNFALGTAMIGVVGVVLYSALTLLPLYLQGLMGYSALDSGLTLSPRGLGAVVAMVLVGRLIGKVDSRYLIGFGFTLLAYSTYLFSGINLDIDMMRIVWPNVIMGVALGFVFVPMTTLAMGGLPNEQMGNGAGLFNLMRNLGGGIGISVVTTMLARGAQTHQTLLAEHMTPDNPQFARLMEHLGSVFSYHADPVLADQQAYAVMYRVLTQQANMLAYLDNFRSLAVMCLLCIPCVIFFKRVRRGRAVAGH
ncbi:MAG: DHA2 family efflux MFS transporter permease subunit [Desulfovibrionaceae bacterium]